MVGFFCFIWIPMLCVYSQYKHLFSYSAGIKFRRLIYRRLILTSKVDSRTVRVEIGQIVTAQTCVCLVWHRPTLHQKHTLVTMMLQKGQCEDTVDTDKHILFKPRPWQSDLKPHSIIYSFSLESAYYITENTILLAMSILTFITVK